MMFANRQRCPVRRSSHVGVVSSERITRESKKLSGLLGRLQLLVILLFPFSAPVMAQNATPASVSDEIVVTGSRVSTLDLKRLLKAETIFRNGRATFAPTSFLLFQLRAATSVQLSGMTLQLRDGNRILPVAIDSQGRFSLPELPRGRWELVHNRGAGRIAVRALVLSDGADEANRSLGDLRLQCRVSWELKKSDYSFMARAGFDAIGGCSSSSIAFYFLTPGPIATATITNDNNAQLLLIRNDHAAYRAPLSDKALPNTARILVRYN